MSLTHQHIDLHYLQDFSNGNSAFVREIILVSVEQTDEEIQNLKTANRTEDYARIAQICHKLRSSLGFMGIRPQLIETLKQVELMALANDSAVRSATENIIAVCGEINLELQEALRNVD